MGNKKLVELVFCGITIKPVQYADYCEKWAAQLADMFKKRMSAWDPVSACLAWAELGLVARKEADLFQQSVSVTDVDAPHNEVVRDCASGGQGEGEESRCQGACMYRLLQGGNMELENWAICPVMARIQMATIGPRQYEGTQGARDLDAAHARRNEALRKAAGFDDEYTKATCSYFGTWAQDLFDELRRKAGLWLTWGIATLLLERVAAEERRLRKLAKSGSREQKAPIAAQSGHEVPHQDMQEPEAAE